MEIFTENMQIKEFVISNFLMYLEEKWGLKLVKSVKKYLDLSLISISTIYIH